MFCYNLYNKGKKWNREEMSREVVFDEKLLPYLIRSNFFKTTYDISLDSQISFLPLGFSPTFAQTGEERIQ